MVPRRMLLTFPRVAYIIIIIIIIITVDIILSITVTYLYGFKRIGPVKTVQSLWIRAR